MTGEHHDGRSGIDGPLVTAWVAGDQAALRLAWERLGTLVYTYCFRALNDRDVAAEYTQETFVAAWRARGRFDPVHGSLAGWFMGIAREKVIDAQRTRLRMPIPSVAGTEGDDLATKEAARQLADRLLLAHALRRLPEPARQVIELAFYSDLSQVQIAERLDVPVSAVQSAMRHGIGCIADHLGGGAHA